MQDVKLKQFPDGSFIDEITVLPFNDAFWKAIKKIRPKFGIRKVDDIWDDKRPETIQEWLDIYQSFENKLEEVESIAKKCRLGKGKYKEAMIQSILALILFDDPYIPWYRQDYSLELPLLKVDMDLTDKIIHLNFEIYHDTKFNEIVKTLKKSWKQIEKKQKQIHLKRIRPFNILHKPRGYYLLNGGLTPMEIYKQIPEDAPDNEKIQPATIYKEQERVNKRIAQAYLDT